MTAFLSHSAVLTVAALLAMPAGWCCRAFTHDIDGALSAKTECCRNSSSERSGEKQPAVPHAECCCPHDAAIPAKGSELSDTPVVALTAVLGLGSINPGADYGRYTAVSLFDPGPKLHVLQCVWRC